MICRPLKIVSHCYRLLLQYFSMLTFSRRASPQVSRKNKAPKPTYIRLDELKAGTVVCVYGVVVFFKPPFRSRGTGWSRTKCSSEIETSRQKETSDESWISADVSLIVPVTRSERCGEQSVILGYVLIVS